MAHEVDWNSIRVLVLDDNGFFRSIVGNALRGAGVRHIEQVSDAADAFSILKSNQIDIALVDYLMEPLDGLDFTRLVRSAKDISNHQLPIIIITGDATQRTLMASIEAGAHDFLAKPITASALISRIHRTLAYPRPFVKRKGFYGPAPPKNRAKTLGQNPRSNLPDVVLIDKT